MEGERAAKPPKRLSDQQVTLGLAVMTAVVLLAALWTARGVNPLRGDSYEYLYFDASRSVGYPAFLALIRLITGSWRGFGGAALVGLVSLLALPFRKRLAPRFRQIIPATAAMGIAFHGTLAITAIVEIGFFRYLVPVWPTVCTVLAVAVVGATKVGPRPVSAVAAGGPTQLSAG
jgi:hypothetical protein